jgi:hypothetical protein
LQVWLISRVVKKLISKNFSSVFVAFMQEQFSTTVSAQLIFEVFGKKSGEEVV